MAQGIAPGEFGEMVDAIRAGATYVNVHTTGRPGARSAPSSTSASTADPPALRRMEAAGRRLPPLTAERRA